MRKKAIFTVILITVIAMPAFAFGVTVTATSTSSGKYEDGILQRSGSSFKAVYVIDEAEGEIRLSRILENNREGRYSEGDSYEIVNVLESRGPSALLVSRDKKDQKIYTAVREGYMGAFETLVIGEDFYEYSNAANGGFYLENGEVEKGRR